MTEPKRVPLSEPPNAAPETNTLPVGPLPGQSGQAILPVQAAVQVTVQPTVAKPVPPHDPIEATTLTTIYLHRRLEAQQKFFESRITENNLNSDFAYDWSQRIIIASSLLSTVNALLGVVPVLSIMAALLPVFATLLASFERIYGWDRQTSLYKDAVRGLRVARTILPRNNPNRTEQEYLLDLITQTEKTLSAESMQWGQTVLEKQPPSGTIPNS